MKIATIIAMVFQVVAAAVALLIPFGFDHPSSLGLDFDHFLWVLVAYSLALLIGVVASSVSKLWGALIMQLLIPIVIVALVYAGAIRI